ncbi:hypothetical protein HWV23_14420 [Natronomonas halophila]|nr:hypothetical protein [Natronomonas halophila]QLD86868.1 hypothetical protein HWV23_14420 [Natronomonas halophila]
MSSGSNAERHAPSDLESCIIDDGGFVIYDPADEDAWLRSDVRLEASECC